jgi:hypothetical protein
VGLDIQLADDGAGFSSLLIDQPVFSVRRRLWDCVVDPGEKKMDLADDNLPQWNVGLRNLGK